jgi:hypothetical protein
MQSFKTFYRLAVMGVTLAIFVMLWRLYGPPAAQLKSMALRAVEEVENMLRPAAEKPPARSDPKSIPADASSAPPLLGLAPGNEAAPAQGSGQSTKQLQAAPLATVSPIAELAGGNSRVESLLARLETLNVQEPQLVAWGSSGKLFRCSCRAAWGQSPEFSRHFESVAAEPEAAVEQVLAQVNAWRTGEHSAR